VIALPPGEPLDLARTFTSGQIFRWGQVGETWYGPFGQAALALTRVEEGVRVECLGRRLRRATIARFLGLEIPLAEVYRQLSADPGLHASIAALHGMRILQQDPWECLVGYLCSQWNQIPKIELSTERIARRWGTRREFRHATGDVEVACLPPPQRLAVAESQALAECALGYRAPYLRAAAARVAAEPGLWARLRRAAYDAALRELLTLPGVGRKVADCVLLFSLAKWEAVPIDVWVRRALHEGYAAAIEAYLPDRAARAAGPLSAVEYRALAAFARDRWGRFAGYAQQYLFTARRLGILPLAGARVAA